MAASAAPLPVLSSLLRPDAWSYLHYRRRVVCQRAGVWC